MPKQSSEVIPESKSMMPLRSTKSWDSTRDDRVDGTGAKKTWTLLRVHGTPLPQRQLCIVKKAYCSFCGDLVDDKK